MCLVPWILYLALRFFMATSQGRPHDHLALVSSWACGPGSHGTVTNGETVLSWLPTQDIAQTAS